MPPNDPELAYEGRRFRVERWNVAAWPDHPWDIIVHPGAAVVLPILDDGRVVMIANYRVVADGELLELPAGTIDEPETPLDCARRELTEETGYTASRIDPLLSFYSTPGVCTERMHAFLASDLTLGKTQQEPGELIRITPMAYDEVLQAIGDGRIVDAKTIVTLLYYDRYVRNSE